MGRGHVLLVLALLLFAPPASAAPTHQVLFTERTTEFHAEGSLAESETRGYRFVVAQPNVTRIDFLLAWDETGDSSGLSKPDTLSMQVHKPDGAAVGGLARSANGQLQVVAAGIAPLPADFEATDDDIPARLAAATTHEGEGEWRVSVRLEDTGNPQGARVDNTNAFELRVLIHFYEATPMRVVSLGKPVQAIGVSPQQWSVALGGLLVLASLLAAGIAWQGLRRRPKRISPPGDNTASSDR